MNYPSKIDRFTEKLNKKHNGSVYVVEEEVILANGIYEELLKHDNINVKSVRVFTGPKLSGDTVDNFILSVPSETPWKLLIKIFSSEPKLYVSYETPGDTVEADDINLLQESITNTQLEVERYKTSTDVKITEHHNRIDAVERSKADKTYTDAELLKKADKLNTYTKSETDQRIKNIIGAAPASLDTLKELSDALNNDPNFATNIINQLSSKVDKETGKQLSTEDYTLNEKTKLAGIEAEANKYIHPSTHPASMITQDTSRRFVSDQQINIWNAKESQEGAQAKADSAETNAKSYSDRELAKKVADVDAILEADRARVNAHDRDTTRHITAAERSSWNAKASTATATTMASGLMSSTDKTKLDGVANNANNYVHPTTHPPSIITQDASNRFVTDEEKVKWNGKQNALGFTPENVANKGKANGYAGLDASSKVPLAQIPNEVVTQDKLGAAGYGDMVKSVYDADNDGVVDRAKTADTVGGRSALSFAYSERNDVGSVDLNTIIQSGMYRLGGTLLNAPTGVTYGQLIVSRGGGDTIAQIVTDYSSNNIYWRSGNPPDVGGSGAWGAWRFIWHDGNAGSGRGLDADMLDGKHASEFMKKGPVTWNNLKGV